MIEVLKGLLEACPGTPIAVLLPFGGNQAANLQARHKCACGLGGGRGISGGTLAKSSNAISLPPLAPGSGCRRRQ